MELTEAVRIVREQTIPALAGSGGGGHVAALGAVLAALEQAQKLIVALETQCDPSGDLRNLILTRDENAMLRAALAAERAAHHDAAAQWQEEARLRREAQGEAFDARHAFEASVREAEALHAEVERLRAALREIEAISAGWDEDGPTVPAHGISWRSAGLLAVDLARAALRDTAPKPAGPTAEEAERCRKASGPCTCGAHITGLGDWAATAPAEETGYAPTDAIGDARAEAAEPRCVRCGSRYSPGGACSRRAEGCQGGRGEWTTFFPPAEEPKP